MTDLRQVKRLQSKDHFWRVAIARSDTSKFFAHQQPCFGAWPEFIQLVTRTCHLTGRVDRLQRSRSQRKSDHNRQANLPNKSGH